MRIRWSRSTSACPRRSTYETTSLPTTGIEKHPVDGPGADHLRRGGGQRGRRHPQPRRRVHAGLRLLGRGLRVVAGRSWAGRWSPGTSREQLTTEGIDLNAALVGEIWRVGTALPADRARPDPVPDVQGLDGSLAGTTPRPGSSGSCSPAGPARTSGCSRRASSQAGDDDRGRARARTTASPWPSCSRALTIRPELLPRLARRAGPEAVDLRAGSVRWRAGDLLPG